MFPQCSIYYTSNNSIKEEHQVFSRSVVNFPDNYHRYCARFLSQPILLPETPGFWELLWAPTPGHPLRFCPGDLTMPPDPQLARAMTFACRHDIIVNPTNFWWWWFEGGGGSHEIFTNREGGSTVFLLLPGGNQKFNSLSSRFYPPPPPREVKNDNSLTPSKWTLLLYLQKEKKDKSNEDY